MNPHQTATLEFHEKFGAAIGDRINLDHREVRAKLIMEEAVETCAALGYRVSALIDEQGIPGERAHREVARFTGSYDEPNLVEVIDGLCDLLYVVYGAAVTMGIDLDPFYAEVHRSNMAKEGGGTRADGKILKPAGWLPPDIESILNRAFDDEARWKQIGLYDQPERVTPQAHKNGLGG